MSKENELNRMAIGSFTIAHILEFNDNVIKIKKNGSPITEKYALSTQQNIEYKIGECCVIERI